MNKLDEFGELLHTLNVWKRATERLNACNEGAPWRYRQELRSDERKTRDGYMALLSVNAPALITLARQSAEQAARVVELEAENARLREPNNTCEAPEVAAMRYIDQLRADEGDSVIILCDNPGDFDMSYNNAIDCNGGWTDWKDMRFTGESVIQCLAKAVTARAATSREGMTYGRN